MISGANIERSFNIKRVFYLFIQNRGKRTLEIGGRREESGICGQEISVRN
jgi:hypothetical protein